MPGFKLDRKNEGFGAAIVIVSTFAGAQPPLPMCVDPVRLLVLDEEAIDNGKSPNLFTDQDVNLNTADIGSEFSWVLQVIRYIVAQTGLGNQRQSMGPNR